MIRKAFRIEAKPGMAAEYERRHNPIWPELEKILKSLGISNNSIFLHEESNALFGYFEVEDEERLRKIEEEEVARRWWWYMTEVLVVKAKRVKKEKRILKNVK